MRRFKRRFSRGRRSYRGRRGSKRRAIKKFKRGLRVHRLNYPTMTRGGHRLSR